MIRIDNFTLICANLHCTLYSSQYNQFHLFFLAGDLSKWVHDVTWNVNGTLLITANANGEIRFWEEKKVNEETKWEEFQQRSKPIKLEDHMVTSRTQPNQV